MINKLKILFPHFVEKECWIETSDKEIEIYDHEKEKRCYLDKRFKTEFTVINPSEKKINFIAVDSCLLSSSDPSRSDCMVFDEKTVCFIELKKCKKKNVKDNQKGAIDQLEAFVKFFIENSLNIDKKLEAYVCVRCRRTDEVISRMPKIGSDTRRALFLEKYKTKLFYKCEKEFT